MRGALEWCSFRTCHASFLILSMVLFSSIWTDLFPCVSTAPSMIVINPEVRHTTRRPSYKRLHHENGPFRLDNHIRATNIAKKSASMKPTSTTSSHNSMTSLKHHPNHPSNNHPNQHLQFHVILTTTRPPFQPGLNGMTNGLQNAFNNALNNNNNNGVRTTVLSRVKRRGARGGGFGNQGRKGPRDRLDYRKNSSEAVSTSMLLFLVLPLQLWLL